MNIYRAMVDASTPNELAELIHKMAVESAQHRTNFYAEKRAHDNLKSDIADQIRELKEIQFDHNVPREHREVLKLCAEEMDKLLLN
jgi:hypothetical protein